MAENDFYREGGSWMRELASVTENVYENGISSQ